MGENNKKGFSQIISTCSFFYKKAIEEKKSYIYIILSYILVVAAAPFINIIVPKFIIDELTGDKNITNLAIYVTIIIFGNYIFAIVIRVLNETRLKHEDWFARVFEMMLSKKAMTMKFENTEIEKTIEAERKAETGMSWYSGGIRGLSDCIIAIVSSLITLVGVAYIIVTVSPVLIIIASLAVIINAFATSKINKAQQEVFEKTPAINKFYSYIYQKIIFREYAKELRLYDASDLVVEKSYDNANTLNKMDNECAVKQYKWGVLATIFSALNYGFSYCWLGSMAIRGEMTIAEFVMCITALETFTNSCLVSIIQNIQGLVMKCNFMGAFVKFMNIDDEEKIGTDSVSQREKIEIEFRHVFFKYPGSSNYILEDINIKIKDGERLSIVGLNGAGKSTFVKLLCRLYDVTKGEILINGKNINEFDYSEYTKLLSVVFQDFKLFSYSIDENICIGTEKETPDMNEIYRMSGIDSWVNNLKGKGNTLLYKNYDSAGVEPSGGQAQKVAIARAVYRDSPIIVLDEPTAALDPVAEYEIYKKFNELISNKTAIYISHRLSSCKFCDKIAVFNNKSIQEYDSHEILLKKNGLYAQMYNTQAQWYVE